MSNHDPGRCSQERSWGAEGWEQEFLKAGMLKEEEAPHQGCTQTPQQSEDSWQRGSCNWRDWKSHCSLGPGLVGEEGAAAAAGAQSYAVATGEAKGVRAWADCCKSNANTIRCILEHIPERGAPREDSGLCDFHRYYLSNSVPSGCWPPQGSSLCLQRRPPEGGLN